MLGLPENTMKFIDIYIFGIQNVRKKKIIKVNKKSSFLTFKLGVFFRFSAIVEVANLLCTILFKAEKEWEGKRVIHSGLQSSPPLHSTVATLWTSVTVQTVLRIGLGCSLDWMNNTQSSDRFAFSDTSLWTKTIGCKIIHWFHFVGKWQDNVVGLACLQAKLLISRLQFQPIHAIYIRKTCF